MAVDAGSIYSEIRIALDKLQSDILKANTAFDKFGTSNTKQAQKVKNTWSKSFQGMSLASTVAIGAMTLAFKKAISTFANTEQSLANVRAVTGATAEEFEILKNSAEEAGRTTRFTAGQSADALYYLGSAGFTATQSVEALNGVLTLAGATGSNLASTSESVASSISAFNLEASDASKVANVFAAAIGNSQATMNKLSTSMRYVAPVASAFNQSIEGTVGLLQILYNNGFEASQAGTALRSALSDLANASSPANAKLQELGVSFEEINPQTHSFAEIFGVLNEKVTDASDVMAIFGDRAGPAMIKLIEAGEQKINQYTEAVTGTNSAMEQYNIQNDTLAGSMDMFKSALEGTSNSLVEQLAPILRTVFDFLSLILNTITKMPTFLKSLTAGFLGFATVAGVVTKALTLMGVSFSASLGPITLVAGAIGAVLTSLTALDKAIGKSRIKKEYEELALQMITINSEAENTVEAIKEFSKQTGISITNSIQIADEQGIITDEIREQVELLKQQEEGGDAIKRSLDEELKLRDNVTRKMQKQLNDLFWTRDEVRNVVKETGQFNDAIAEVMEATGATRAEVIEWTKNVEFLGDASKSIYAKIVEQYNSEISAIETISQKEAGLSAQRIAQQRKENEERLKQEELDRIAEEKQQAEADRLKRLEDLYAEYNKANEESRLRRNTGLITETQLYMELVKNKENYIQAIIAEGYNNEEVLKARVAELDKLKAKLKELQETEKEEITIAEDTYNIKRRLDNAEAERLQKAIDYYNRRNEVHKEANEAELEEEKRHAEEMEAIRQQFTNNILSFYQTLVTELNKGYQADRDNEIKAVQEKVDAGVLTEEAGQKEIALIKYRKDLANWKSQNLAIIGNIAQGITTAIASIPWPLNLIPIAFATATGGLQLTTQERARPQPPKLETGGIILPKTGGTTATLAENGSAELAFNLGAKGEPFVNYLADKLSERIGGGLIKNSIFIDGKTLAEITAQYFNDGVVEVRI